ncbi:MAG: 16S rRNA (cytidine(1402)-2'-O)-methyltransferase [Alphaproteobacteria bacterium]|nr:16S rRNA (cytidine(1402)-2'-O)-methyltransferase [Alphaproteobacteria bacterium]
MPPQRYDETKESDGVAHDPLAGQDIVTNSETAAVQDGREAEERSKPTPGLYIAATPIGNLRDVTLRTLGVLRAADLIACEDTRITVRLLQRYGITAPMTSYHEHNAERVRPRLLEKLAVGAVVALVSDAGTPLISDPGYKLVRAAQSLGYCVTVLPGPSAALAALVLAGLPTDRFLFAGFLPAKSSARRRAIAAIKETEATLVFFESARRLADCLADLVAELGDREAAIARELTKIHEEVVRAPLSELSRRYSQGPTPKGEITIVVAGPDATAPVFDDAEIDNRLRMALATQSVARAASAVAAASGRDRRTLYRRAVVLKREPGTT